MGRARTVRTLQGVVRELAAHSDACAAGRNKLTKTDGLEGLTMLTELSLEDNEITDLQGLAGLPSLMELYLCNNKVSD